MFRLILFSLILVISCSLLFSQTSSVFPLKVSVSGRYFLNASNKPHFLKGDTPWQLIVDLSEEEAKYYFRKRMQQGVNSILVDMLSKVSMTMRQQMYWFLLSGGLGGFINGHIELWGFPDKWKEMLETRNTKSIQVFNELVQELEWWNLVPNFPDSSNTIIIKGRGEYGSPGYIPVSLTKDNRKMIAYIPSNHTGEFTLDCRRFSLKHGKGFWINPATGEKCDIQALPSDSRFKIPENRGDMINDWFLVLQTFI